MKREAASAAHVQPFQMLHSQFARHYPPNPCYTAIPLATPFALSPPAGWSIGAASAHRAIDRLNRRQQQEVRVRDVSLFMLVFPREV